MASNAKPSRVILSRIALVIVVAGASIATGVVQSTMVDPRRSAEIANRAVHKLETPFPETLGEWIKTDVNELDREAIAMLQCLGSNVCSYANARTGSRVSVALLLGPSGPISAHTPETCIPSDQYQHTTRQRIPLAEGGQGDLWDVSFAHREDEARSIRCLYGWSEGGRWFAADSPRFQFASSPFLYKLQVSVVTPRDAANVDPVKDFLVQFIPECSAKLTSDPRSPTAVGP